jgi:catechol 2,3-dioxygenase-like lactoylglutathione lyase family enzyme
MVLKHVALLCRSETNSDRFYQNVLGLKKIRSKVLSPSLSKGIFDIDREYTIIDYKNEDVHFEIFVGPRKTSDDKRIDHICLEVDDLGGFLETCRARDVRILRIPKDDGFIIFIQDYDGNLFEIKEKR